MGVSRPAPQYPSGDVGESLRKIEVGVVPLCGRPGWPSELVP